MTNYKHTKDEPPCWVQVTVPPDKDYNTTRVDDLEESLTEIRKNIKELWRKNTNI